MTKEERLIYIDMALKINKIEINKSILESVIKIIDVIDCRGEKTNIKEILKALK